MFYLTTERLCLRRLADHDLDTFVAYRADPEIGRYQGWRPLSTAEAQTFITEQQTVAVGTHEEWTQIAIALKATDELVGDCALRVHDNGRQAEFGVTLAGKYHGRGYATEALQTLFTYGFETLNLHRIFGIADTRNRGSIAVMERLGMRREAHTIQAYWDKGEWTDEYWYALLKSEWEVGS